MGVVISEKKLAGIDTGAIAQSLLGNYLVRLTDKGKKIEGMICEVESYDGPHDQASHARVGITNRNKVMFGEAGTWYIYVVYGMYHMINIVTGPNEYPAAILIRSAGDVSGPGRLAKFFGVDMRFNAKKAVKKNKFFIENRGIKIPKKHIVKSARIGIPYAGPVWSTKKLRFYLT